MQLLPIPLHAPTPEGSEAAGRDLQDAAHGAHELAAKLRADGQLELADEMEKLALQLDGAAEKKLSVEAHQLLLKQLLGCACLGWTHRGCGVIHQRFFVHLFTNRPHPNTPISYTRCNKQTVSCIIRLSAVCRKLICRSQMNTEVQQCA